MSAYDYYRFGLLNADDLIFHGWPDYIESDGFMWAKIRGYPEYYISEDGRVMSFVRYPGIILHQSSTNHGHMYVDLSNRDGTKSRHYVHRLVADHFIENPNRYPVVRHMDDDPRNNEFDNLAWGTQADNMQDCKDHNRDYHKPVYCYELNKTFRSGADAAEYFDVAKSLITLACQGKVHMICDKYHLCFLEDKDEKLSDPDKYFITYNSNKPVKAINVKTGEMIIFESRKQAAEALHMSDTGISNVIAGRLKHACGWYFEDCSGR